MKVKIPKQIKIGVHTYTISFNPYLLGDSRRHGEANHRKETIDIQSDNPDNLKLETLIHEIIHIAEFYYRVDISDPDIDRIAEVITEFIVDNLGIEFDWGDINPS